MAKYTNVVRFRVNAGKEQEFENSFSKALVKLKSGMGSFFTF